MTKWLYDLIEDERKEADLLAKVKDVDKIVNAGIATLEKALDVIGITKEEHESVLVK